MTDTPAESAEAPRTPEKHFGDFEPVCNKHPVLTRDGSVYSYPWASRCQACAALAARDAEWREAIRQLSEDCCPACWLTDPPLEDCDNAAPLRALLSEGPGK